MKTITIDEIGNISQLLDCVYDRIGIVDSEGYLIWVNKAFEEYGFPRETLLYKHMNELIDMGVMDYSAVMECMRTGSACGIGRVHRDKCGNSLNWVAPHIDERGDVDYYISTEWDMRKLSNMEEFQESLRTFPEEELNELNDYRSKNAFGDEIVYGGESMGKILSAAACAAQSDANILIRGETGTGKELLAKYVHSQSARAKEPLINVNCGAIPDALIESELFGYEKGAFTGAAPQGKKGLFEAADRGTLFLDEIGELPLHVQSKLLRVLQEKRILRVGGTRPVSVDVRILSATNADLETAVREKRFRIDLYYRLNVMPLVIPPLRDRREDIALLTRYYLNLYQKKYRKDLSFSEEALLLMRRYDWPGNVRELQNLIERLCIIEPDGVLGTAAIFEYLQGGLNAVEHACKPDANEALNIDLNEAIEIYERNLLQKYMNRHSNIRQYADFLNVTKSTLARKLQKHGLRFLSQTGEATQTGEASRNGGARRDQTMIAASTTKPTSEMPAPTKQ
ncbi:MAG: sigma 54-interacting transcriptional regulator [Clostridiales Family XIII bacterium]|nr:sigma 54-interacting transcriptional regulator [Clostridiales Family XIII bacterium]